MVAHIAVEGGQSNSLMNQGRECLVGREKIEHVSH